MVTSGTAPSASSSDLRLQILGPLRVWRGERELDTGPRQQAHVMATLFARPERPTSVDELIEMTWGWDPPTTAQNAIHRYVGAARRVLEPELGPREAGSYLHRRGEGYLCVAGSDLLDLVRFRQYVATASVALSNGAHEAALDDLERALDLWKGPAGGSVPANAPAAAAFAELNDEFFRTCLHSAELAASMGQSDRFLRPLHLAATMAPLNEPVQAGLIAALADSGRRAEALNLYRAVRARLIDELGIDPGDALQRAHQAVLTQVAGERPTVARSAAPAAAVAGAAPPTERHHVRLIGREREITDLRLAFSAVSSGGVATIVVEGDAGSGKTRLLEGVLPGFAADGADVVWGRCLQGPGMPAMWPWLEVLSRIVGDATAADPAVAIGPDLSHFLGQHAVRQDAPAIDAGGMFRLLRDVIDVIAEAARNRPVLIAIDDLHWADAGSLMLLTRLAGELPAGSGVLVALRTGEPGAALAQALAALGGAPGHRRVVVPALRQRDIAEMVEQETGRPCPDEVAALVLKKTSGNAFFAKEVSRLLATEPDLTTAVVDRMNVPASVRDVVRHSVSALEHEERDVLWAAAVIGRDFELPIAAAVTGIDLSSCLVRLDVLHDLGVVAPKPGRPFSYSFSHDLVRQAVDESIPRDRWRLLHVSTADALERLTPAADGVRERIAQHLWSAGPLADPARTVLALIEAGRRAVTKSALDTAEEQMLLAVESARNADLSDCELVALNELLAVVGIRSRFHVLNPQLLERTEQLTGALGKRREASALLYLQWNARAQNLEVEAARAVASRMLGTALESTDPVVSANGFHAWGAQCFSDGDLAESRRWLERAGELLAEGGEAREADPLWYDLRRLYDGMLAEAVALTGDVKGARTLLARLEGADDTFGQTVWAAHTARMEAMIGDPARALAAAERGIAVDPGFEFGFIGTYPRVIAWWARAMLGGDAAEAAVQAERLIAENLVEPPRADVTAHFGLLSEIWLVAGDLHRASEALDRAHEHLDLGQMWAEGLLLLMRAQLEQRRGRPADEVGALLESARLISEARGTILFAEVAEHASTTTAEGWSRVPRLPVPQR